MLRPVLLRSQLTVVAAILAALLACTAPHSAGAAPDNRSPYAVASEVELPLVLSVGLGAMLLPRLLTPSTLEAPPCGGCDPQQIWSALDRGAVDNDSRAAALASDVLLISLNLGATFGSLIDVAIDDDDEGTRGWGKDLLVTTEALTITLALTQLAKYLGGRRGPSPTTPRWTARASCSAGRGSPSSPATPPWPSPRRRR